MSAPKLQDDVEEQSQIETDVVQLTYPWVEKKNASANDLQNEQSSSNPGFTTPDDPESPMFMLATLTMMLSNKNCALSIVPTDLRDLVKKEVKLKSVEISQNLLMRLNDLNAVSSKYLEEFESVSR